ncbi:long-chain fatty acid transporter [Taibaiella sp. KBW10]|uniref:OmpP1/FadL family transporter n=1 Tax=Taibaiella sp. KBW10 TaxID=2153357 RepID=UPI000F5B5079|nr:outer membrane protein transport protein [Taibaiella sp. KBW10]RQO32588.1 long-chain fatty acid transporter [Taibaiella sp. KBW10]
MKKRFIFSVAACTLSAASLYAGSFQLNLQGLRQTAMGGSGVAMPWDISTLFYNPAGLARLQGVQAYAGVFAVSPTVRYVPDNSGETYAETKQHLSTPFAVYVGAPLSKDSKWALGLGIYTPFGSSANWGKDWTGRFITQSIALQSIYFQPTVSYRINDRIALGAGFVYGTGSVKISKALPVQDINGNEGQAKLDGKANGIGFNAGVQIKASDKLQFGVSYRSGVRMKVNDGKATFTVPTALTSNFPNTIFDATLPLPGILTAGLAFKVSPRLTLQGDLVFAGWHSYDSLKFDFAQNTGSLADSREPRLYKNTLAVRIGGHYEISNAFAVMVGGAYDPTPSNSRYVSPDAVDADRISLSAGLSYAVMDKLSIMAAVNYTTTAGRKVRYEPANFSGEYQIKSLVPAIGISYKF